MKKFKFTYYGTRGSIPAPGKNTSVFGGNTTCLYSEYYDDTQNIPKKIAIDAGSGIRSLGMELMKTEFGKGTGVLDILITHTHWDHIQGFPFFIPAYVPGNKINMMGLASGEDDLQEVFSHQQRPQNFPVNLNSMASQIDIKNLDPSVSFNLGDIGISCLEHAHPGGALGYKLTVGKFVLVFCTDVEHLDDMPDLVSEFAKDADVLAYDAQYLEKEYKTKIGWGHSTHEMAVQIAQKAGVKELHLIHHDPQRNDADLLESEKKLRKQFKNLFAAREGMMREYSI